MYVDTKNLTAASTMAQQQQQQQQQQPAATTLPKNQMRRMRKVWQPLKRLLTVGGKGRPTQLTLVHPNNVDLNNTQQQQQQQQQQHHLQLEEFTDDESKSTLELDASSTLSSSSSPLLLSSTSDKIVEQVVDLTPPPNTPTLISSVYVEKVSINQGCGSCQHGRNCQHTHHQPQSQSQSQSQFQPHPQQSNHLPLPLPLPLQYISTDNGTFFWANTQERVDDDLLHAWLCQSFSQLPGTLC
ncbi:LOW QUALITY PROTEIN: enhancer of split M2 protein [Drosophila tropicalis]|uniref:LOW QUALITY PROTEIN: enhancer of split M2 protein n=1 Tax=Drosophila tropicalis TaxID=46794 RepID=UPI0035AC1A36